MLLRRGCFSKYLINREDNRNLSYKNILILKPPFISNFNSHCFPILYECGLGIVESSAHRCVSSEMNAGCSDICLIGTACEDQHSLTKGPLTPCPGAYEGVSKSFWTESITDYMLTTINTRSETTQRVMVTKLTKLTHNIAIQLHLVAESSTICSSRSRRSVRTLLDTRV
jgi:hypothetical protein